MTVIDVHTHMLNRDWLELIREHGRPRYEIRKSLDAPEGIMIDGAPGGYQEQWLGLRDGRLVETARVLAEEDAVVGAPLRRLADPVDQPPPALRVRRLERIVVALHARPDDEVRADRACELGRRDRAATGLRARLRIGRDEAATAEARIEVEAARERVDVMRAERLTDLLEVPLVELARVVELVAVDQVAEPVHGPPDPLDGRLAGPLRLIPRRDEPGDHRPERPDPEARLHLDRTSSLLPLAAERRIASTTSSQR
jgi:hypothetical protein